MENPEKQLKAYLENLVYNFIFIKSILHQINLLIDWTKKNGEEGIVEGEHFYSIVFYTFKRVLVLELCKLLTEREDRSLLDWLHKAKEHASSLKPSRYARVTLDDREYVPISVDEYRRMIDQNFENISSYNEVIKRVKSLRDRNFAHADKEYFDNQDKVDVDFPLSWDDLNNLFDCIESILKEHYSVIYNVDMSMDLVASQELDNILNSTRAFTRIWKNKKLSEIGMKKYVFKKDDYDPEDVLFQDF